MIISHKYKFIFISNGKTGTKSIEESLSKYQEGEEFNIEEEGLYTKGHIPPSTIKELVGGEIWFNYFKFCFVRNPWDWLVSQYFYNFCYKPRKILMVNNKNIFKYDENINDQWKHIDLIENKKKLNKYDIIDIYNYLKQYRGISKAKSLFQYYYIYDLLGNKLVDYVGRFENLIVDYNEILKMIGLREKLSVINKTDHENYDSYYDIESAELVKKLYEIDIKSFNYRF